MNIFLKLILQFPWKQYESITPPLNHTPNQSLKKPQLYQKKNVILKQRDKNLHGNEKFNVINSFTYKTTSLQTKSKVL